MANQERYLTSIDLGTVPALTPDVLIIGSGVAGLSAALVAAQLDKQVLLVTKDALAESNTFYAQGGIATAMGEGDNPEDHLQDTLKAGVDLCDEDAVRVLVTEGVDRCQDLLDWGAPFDRSGEEVAFTMEGGHGRRRVIHASGDATGKAVAHTLLERAKQHENVRLVENHFAIDLLHHEGECYGALLLDTTYGRLLRVEAGATIVASGGLGQIYRETTNPDVATGDGLALCFRAGTVMRDMEFVQFHPTTLYLAGAPRFLISESVRGEGAYLLNAAGERFMPRYSEDAELAPRDIVSRSIMQETNSTGSTNVQLDLRHLPESLVQRRFPTIGAICADYGLNLAKDLIPVRPAVHYTMGGVKVDLDARTNVRRLLAAGEVSCSGVHGANRLASNSLLEGLVFGYRAGKTAAKITDTEVTRFPLASLRRVSTDHTVPLDIEDVLRSLKSLTWRCLGVYREKQQIEMAESTIVSWERYVLPERFQARGGFEIQNMLSVAKLIARAALLRTESRGAHQRTDYPDTDPSWLRHLDLSIADFEE